MRARLGIVIAVLVGSAVGWVWMANAQNQKPADPLKKAVEAAKKPADATKKPAEPAKPAPAPGAKAAAPAAQAPAAQPATSTAAVEDADEKTIRASAEAFTRLYNAHDSKGLAAMFTPKAEVIDEDGLVTRGREAIEKEFASVFKENPEASMEVEIESVRVLTGSLAIEEGVARSMDGPGAPVDVTTYVAIHAKVDGKWLLACIRDWEAPPEELTPHEHLQELAWMVGDWVEEGSEATVHTSCRWDASGNFLIQEFSVRIEGEIAKSGTMRIGWDAVAKQFKSWVFDSEGGHSEAMWVRNADEWSLRARGSTAAGEASSAVNVIGYVDADTMTWRSYDRIVDGERTDDIDEVVIKRRAPAPSE